MNTEWENEGERWGPAPYLCGSQGIPTAALLGDAEQTALVGADLRQREMTHDRPLKQRAASLPSKSWAKIASFVRDE